MPFELGIDIGCITFGSDVQKTKVCLILDAINNKYDSVISDISGQDIKVHNNSKEKIIQQVLDWFSENGSGITYSSPSLVWNKYQDYINKLNIRLRAEGLNQDEINNLPISQFIKAMKSAIRPIT